MEEDESVQVEVKTESGCEFVVEVGEHEGYGK